MPEQRAPHSTPASPQKLTFGARLAAVVTAVRDGDQQQVEETIMRLSRSRQWLAPLSLIVGAFVMLFDGLRLLFTNWKLMLIQILPAMWIWLAMLDLRLHVLHGRSSWGIRGTILIPIGLCVVAITAASFFLNAVFAFAISEPGRPNIRRGFTLAFKRWRPVLGWGCGIGVLLAVTVLVIAREGKPWFALALSLVVGLMMICYVSVPAQLIGVTTRGTSRLDKVAANAMSGLVGVLIATPGYMLGRAGVLMLGTKALFVPGVVSMVLGFTVQVGATGAIRAIKLSARLLAGVPIAASPQTPSDAAQLDAAAPELMRAEPPSPPQTPRPSARPTRGGPQAAQGDRGVPRR